MKFKSIVIASAFFMVASANAADVVSKMAGELTPCSACPSRSVAHSSASALSSPPAQMSSFPQTPSPSASLSASSGQMSQTARLEGAEQQASQNEPVVTDRWKEIPFRVLVPAYMISELKTAFIMGFRIYLPFLVIDMVIATILLSMGMMMLPPVLIISPTRVAP